MFVSSIPKQSKNTPSNDLNINLIIMIQNSKVYFAFFLKKEKKILIIHDHLGKWVADFFVTLRLLLIIRLHCGLLDKV